MTDFGNDSDGTERAGVAVSRVVPIRMVVGSILGRDTGYPGRCFSWFP
jgi:hypothetical protein